MTADFNAQTLTGQTGTLIDNTSGLSVAGTISGNTLSGSVSVPGSGTTTGTKTGTLTGQIGNTGVIGAFHGSSSTNDFVFAGGFVGTKN